MMKAPCAKCDECPLKHQPIVAPYGPANAEIILVGDNPGIDEVKEGRPIAGSAGRLLDESIRRMGYDSDRVWRTHAVLCQPITPITAIKEAAPSQAAIDACRPRLEAELAAQASDKIITLGMLAAETMAEISKTPPITKLGTVRGKWFEWRLDNGTAKMWTPTFDPAAMIKRPVDWKLFAADLQTAYEQAQYVDILKTPVVKVLDTPDDLLGILMYLKARDRWIAFDIETDHLVYTDRTWQPAAPVLMLVLTDEIGKGYVIPREMLEDQWVKDRLNEFFAEHDKFCAHNGKFDILHLRRIGIHARCDQDTILMHAAIDETGPHGLKELATQFFGMHDYSGEYIKPFLKKDEHGVAHYSAIPFDNFAVYAVWDVIITLALRELLWEQMQKKRVVEWPFQNILMPAHEALIEMEWRGIQIDPDQLRAWGERFGGELATLKRQMQEMVRDTEFNPNAPAQCAYWLYDHFKLPEQFDKKTGRRTTKAEALGELEHMHPFAGLLMQYRTLAKLISSYINVLSRVVDVRNRLHCTYNLFRTETGRLSATDPALQTIPRGKDARGYGKAIKSCFVARPGYKLVMADYSQAELRVVAVLSGEEFLLRAYREGRDVHAEGAAVCFGTVVPHDFKTNADAYPEFKEQRSKFKQVIFGFVYGGKIANLLRRAGLYDKAVIARFEEAFANNMPQLVAWSKRQREEIARRGWAISRFNRRRRFPLRTDTNAHEMEQSAVNMPVQSPASDLNTISMIQLNKMGVPIVLVVHDSIIAEVPEEDAARVGALMKDTMERVGRAFFPEITWVADLEIADRWSEPPKEKKHARAA